MSLTVILTIAGLFAVAAAVAVVFWSQILGWVEQVVFPWFDQHLPRLAPLVRQAFAQLDQAVVALRQAARAAWAELRPRVLKAVVDFSRLSSNRWLRVVTTWLAEKLAPGEAPVVTEVREERHVPWDELPADIRESFLRTGEPRRSVDVRALREQELAELEV
ncbi:MAG: hypothetical protein RBU45_16540 [Myxococcota bacterium]|jgi:hypothetical protein|nr:hypothetical protein [Myxococcota bacterium]